jgi:hypothetical protein
MDIKDLKPADILLFSGEKESWISKAIMFLTDSPVSHAAIASEAPATIVEETPPAIRASSVKERIDHRTIYVMRSKQQKSMHPVVNAAMHYLNEKEPYPMSNLYLVGMLLVYRKFTPDTLLKRAMIKIFRILAADIIEFINKHKYPGKLPMVCSQFVYQCYAEAGSDYRLHIKHGTLLKAPMAVQAEEMNVLDYTIHKVKTDRSVQFRTLSHTLQSQPLKTAEKLSEETLAKELVEAMQGKKMMTAAAPEEEQTVNNELALAVNEFAHAVYMSSTGVTQPLTALAQAQDSNMVPMGLSLLKAEEAFFVAPGDLLRHCEDLEQVGVITAA